MIRTYRDGAASIIALSRPERRNALSSAGWEDLTEAAIQAADSDAAAVILTSDCPGIFSAGADLSTLAPLADDIPARTAFRLRMAAATVALSALPMPLIGAIDGGCYGAAVALALTCDICIAGDDAAFAVTPAKLGIGYPGADVARLTARVGRGQAARLLFTADAIDAGEALRIGLVDLRAANARQAATELSMRIDANAPDAIRLLKRTLNDPGGADAGFEKAFGGSEFSARIAAFRNRER